MMVPFTAFGLTAITDKDMDDVTGQAGIDIYFDGFVDMNIAVNDISWGDSDGAAGTSSTAGYININGGSNITVNVQISGSMGIDMGTTPAGGIATSGDTVPANTAYMFMSIPDVTIAINVPDELTLTLASDADATTNAAVMGILSLGTLNVTLDVSNLTGIYICAH
ncbi:MAG: hypothetical protein HQL69_14475 [Magnetococcales bacterium]|nr:hypothetical protein [Magnetococcales bacterium]